MYNKVSWNDKEVKQLERLDFVSVMTALRRNINEDLCPNQLELVETLFCDMGSSPESCMELDEHLHG